MLLIDGVRYRLWTPKDEEREFHPMIKKYSKEIFGEDSIYFDIKHVIRSKSGIGSIPDAYVISLSKPYRWYIVENELSSHPVYSHIVPQISRFINGIDNLRSQGEIRDVLYREITQDKVLKASVEVKVHPEEIHRFVSSLVSRPPRIVIIIDEVTDDVKEASKALRRLGRTEVVEFKTYIREDAENVRAHIFEPIYSTEKISEGVRKEREVEKPTIPEQYQSWDKMLGWVDENTRNIVELLKTEIMLKLKDVLTRTSGRYLCFYKRETRPGYIFAAFNLTKKYLKVRIRADPKTLRDPRRLVKEKVYKAWWFRHGGGEEREITITSKDQIRYAIELVRQSYELAK